MTWGRHHSESEAAAGQADLLQRQGRTEEARSYYAAAANAETLALESLDVTKEKTQGITAVSAVSLWYKAREYTRAEQLAHEWLSAGIPQPRFAVEQLRTLLQTLWTTQAAERAGVKFVAGDVLVSVKGGKVVYGGAPLDLIVRKVEEVQAMFVRTAEMLLGLPLRRRGGPSAAVQEAFQPWLFQVPAGSYQFAIRVQEPAQITLFPDARPQVEQVTQRFLDIVKATAQEPAADLAEIVPNKEYRGAFLKLARNLAPTGKTFDQIDIREASSPASRPISIGPAARTELNAAIRRERPADLVENDTPPTSISGVLRAVHLDQDWLEVTTGGIPELHVRIYDVGELLDDVLGPLVNRLVSVIAARKPNGRLSFRDIESQE